MNNAWIMFLVMGTVPHYSSSSTTLPDLTGKDPRIIGKPSPSTQRCSTRIQATMDSMQNSKIVNAPVSVTSSMGVMDLAGYALHQHLRSAPYDMYVTSMKVHVPARTKWYRIEQCYFDPRNKSLETRMGFNDLAVSGIAKLYDENAVVQDPLLPVPADVCNMTLRLRKSGITMTTRSRNAGWRGPINIETKTQFIEPDYVSVYAAGCHKVSPRIEHRSDSALDENESVQGRYVSDLTREMEDVFVKGIQALLATYMEKQLQPALKETLSTNMGYTISYGK
ncbi:hypothetical protein R5R35_010586 [Gryllus longicercus]|uniref:Secreted protein n=1 Tax=Gryllus longicercus TaxID=2509291 RepID=A0AAN9VGY2_9ORTH